MPHAERLGAQVKVLAAAEQEGILDSKRVRDTINSALRQLTKRNQVGNHRLLEQAARRILAGPVES
jgi:hypothetical protein